MMNKEGCRYAIKQKPPRFQGGAVCIRIFYLSEVPHIVLRLKDLLFDVIGFDQRIDISSILRNVPVINVRFLLDIAREQTLCKYILEGTLFGIVLPVKHLVTGKIIPARREIQPKDRLEASEFTGIIFTFLDRKNAYYPYIHHRTLLIEEPILLKPVLHHILVTGCKRNFGRVKYIRVVDVRY